MQQTLPDVKYVTVALNREEYDQVRTIARRWKWTTEAVLELWAKRGMARIWRHEKPQTSENTSLSTNPAFVAFVMPHRPGRRCPSIDNVCKRWYVCKTMPVRRSRQSSQVATLSREDEPEFCTVTEAADLLGVSVSTVWRWVDSGKLPAFRVGPKAIRIRRTDAAAAVQPIMHREEVTMMNSVFVDVEAAAKPLTREERERGLAALAAADKLREEILKRRKGKPLSDSAAIIREAREERSRRI